MSPSTRNIDQWTTQQTVVYSIDFFEQERNNMKRYEQTVQFPKELRKNARNLMLLFFYVWYSFCHFHFRFNLISFAHLYIRHQNRKHASVSTAAEPWQCWKIIIYAHFIKTVITLLILCSIVCIVCFCFGFFSFFFVFTLCMLHN